MLTTLDILPDQIPAHLHDAPGAAMPRYLLERVPDATGFAAARLAWILHQSFADPETGHILAPLASLDRPTGSPESVMIRCGPQAANQAAGAGFALCPDLSLLVFTSPCNRHWGQGCRDRVVQVLPIVFRLAPLVQTRDGILAPRMLTPGSTPAALYLPMGSRHDPDGRGARLQDQVAAEVCAWAAWASRLPDLEEPGPDMRAGTTWPSFFPHPGPDAARRAAFADHARAALSSILSWRPGIATAHATVFSPRPLQSGIAPARIVTTWSGTDITPKPVLDAHLHDLLFGPSSPWRMDDLVGHILHMGTGDGFTADRIVLFEEEAARPASAHEALRLRTRFPEPPPAPALPGAPGYGTTGLPAAP